MRIVHTNLFSDQAKDILDSVFGQLSDGWGENSPSLNKWWYFARVKRDVTGEVIIEISEDTSHRDFAGTYSYKYISNAWLELKTDAAVLSQIAAWVKKTIYMEIADNNQVRTEVWKRANNTSTSAYLNRKDTITFQDIFIVVDMLTDNFKASNYPVEAILRTVGKINDASTIANERLKQEKLAKIEADFQAAVKLANDELKAEKEALEAKYVEIRSNLQKQRNLDVAIANG